ncbi:MAG: AAA family ATPase, partial [Bdellovibrionales bacterium]|nr:AAA family ATPase [Bdellovibrionales bacterium]
GEAWQSRIPEKNIEFQAGLNFIVGGNGCGKSSVLKAIKSTLEKSAGGKLTDSDCLVSVKAPFQLVQRDFEDSFRFMRSAQNPLEMSLIFDAKQESHGQNVQRYLEGLDGLPSLSEDPLLMLFDEPESGLDFRAVLELSAKFKALENQAAQLIVATHEPLLFLQPNVHVISLDKDPAYIENARTAFRTVLDAQPGHD